MHLDCSQQATTTTSSVARLSSFSNTHQQTRAQTGTTTNGNARARDAPVLVCFHSVHGCARVCWGAHTRAPRVRVASSLSSLISSTHHRRRDDAHREPKQQR